MIAPLFGVGPGNASIMNPANSVMHFTYMYLSPHNFILSIADDLGLLGLAFFIGLICSAFFSVRPSGNRKIEMSYLDLGNALLIALVACSIQGLALDIQNQKLLWVLIGMALAYKRHLNMEKSPQL